MRRILASVLAAAIAAGASAIAAEPRHLTIAVGAAATPWSQAGADGAPAGLAVDLAKAVCEHEGWDCRLVARPSESLIPALLAKQADVVMAPPPPSAEPKGVVYSAAYATAPAKFGVPKASPLARYEATVARVDVDAPNPDAQAALDDLRAAFKGRAVGVVAGSAYARFMTGYLKDQADLRPYPASADALADLAAGHIDAVFDSALALKAAADKGADLAPVGPALTGQIFAADAVAALRKGDPLTPSLDAAFAWAAKTGLVKTLTERWFGVDGTVD